MPLPLMISWQCLQCSRIQFPHKFDLVPNLSQHGFLPCWHCQHWYAWYGSWREQPLFWARLRSRQSSTWDWKDWGGRDLFGKVGGRRVTMQLFLLLSGSHPNNKMIFEWHWYFQPCSLAPAVLENQRHARVRESHTWGEWARRSLVELARTGTRLPRRCTQTRWWGSTTTAGAF